MSSGDSPSDDEEERAKMADLMSVAIDSSAVVESAANSKSKARARTKGWTEVPSGRAGAAGSDSDEEPNGGLKHYQLKAQDALHNFLDTTFGSMISAHDTPGDGASSSSDSEEEERVAVGLEAEKGDAPGFQLFGRLPKRKATTASAIRASEKEKRQRERYDEGREVDEDDEEVKKRLTSAAVEPDDICSAAAKAAARAAAEAKLEDARWQKELTDEGQRVAKLKRERGVAQLIKGRIVMVKEPVSEQQGGGKVAAKISTGVVEREQGEGKKAKTKKAKKRKEMESERPTAEAEPEAEGDMETEGEIKEKKKKKKKRTKKTANAAAS